MYQNRHCVIATHYNQFSSDVGWGNR